MKRIPTCNLLDWTPPAVGRNSLTMRPAWRALPGRIGWSLAWSVLAVGCYTAAAKQIDRLDQDEKQLERETARYLHMVVDRNEEFREESGGQAGAELDEMEQAARERMAREQAELESRNAPVRRAYTWAGTAGVALFGTFAAIPLFGFALGRMRLTRDPLGNLDLFYWKLLPMRRSWRLDEFDTLALYVREDLSRTSSSGRRTSQWTWLAQPQSKDSPIAPIFSEVSFSSSDMGPIFVLDRQRHAPGEDPPIPERVHAFAAAFEQVTDISAGRPQVVDALSASRRALEAVIASSGGNRQVVEQIFSKLSDLPPEMHALIEHGEQQGDGIYVSKREKIIVVDESGQRREYDSLEEAPREVQERFRKLK